MPPEVSAEEQNLSESSVVIGVLEESWKKPAFFLKVRSWCLDEFCLQLGDTIKNRLWLEGFAFARVIQ
jgi:hypothetical protein